MYRRLLAVGALLVATMAMPVAVAQPASAAVGKWACKASGGSEVCISIWLDGNTGDFFVFADIETCATYTGLTCATSDVNFHSPTVAALQCDPYGNNCGAISARSDVGHLWTYFPNEYSKPFSPGHVYKAIGSWIDPEGVNHAGILTAPVCCP